MRKLFALAFFLSVAFNINAQVPCENGIANGYPCNQVDFYAHINNSALAGASGVNGSDIWGWKDPSSRIEYAIMCQTNGTVFISLENPAEPVIVGRLPTHSTNSSWRDAKTYGNYAFIVADNNTGHGMQIFDLRRLREYDGTPLVFDEDAHYDGVSSAHNVVINEAKGKAYIVGARGASNGCGQGGLHIVDITNPLNPVFAGCFDADGYTHDAQVVTYDGPDTEYQGKEISFNSNENTITIADVTDPSNTSLISKQGYSASGYSHQGWLTEDHRYFISNDELDELNGRVSSTRTLLWDVTDLDNPRLISEYLSGRTSIDHNLYTHEGKVFQSNYETGLIILDAERVGKGDIREIAYFDTYPQSNNVSFNGSWSNYPYFESGIVVISDINNGFFVVKPNIQDIVTTHPNFDDCNLSTTLSVETDQIFEVASYQWQEKSSSNQISDLSDGGPFQGVNTATLSIDGNSNDLSNNTFRCKITLVDGTEVFSFLSNKIGNLPESRITYKNDEATFQFFAEDINADEYLWDFGDGNTSNEQNPQHTFETSDRFVVSLTVSNNCGSNSYSEVIDIEQILSNESKLIDGVEAFPNPVTNKLQINSSNPNFNITHVSIYTFEGHLIEEIKLGVNNFIDTSQWEEGAYILVISDDKNRKAVKRVFKN